MTYDTGEYLLQSISRTSRFRFSSIQAIFELKERLADGIGERNTSRVHECDRSDAPALPENVMRVLTRQHGIKD